MSLSNGFGILEVVITTFVIGVVAVGVFSLITLTLKSSHDGQRRIIATALANEKMEQIRNLPYDSVGTVGGVPSGSLVQSQQVIRNGSEYTVATDIRYVDDPYDGTASGNPADVLNTDYKQARVEVSWQSNVSARPVLLITQITPKGVEGGSSLGTLVFQALNAAGAGVAGATVHLSNSQVTPSVDFTTTTNNDGKVTIPGLVPASGTYQLTVSVPTEGSGQEQTETVVFSTPGTFTWTAPLNVTSIDVEAWGGGSIGGNSGGNFGVEGGGGGAYSKAVSQTVVPGAAYTVSVGEGGTIARNNAGGNSWFADASSRFVEAVGGHYVGGEAQYGTGSIRYSGGRGADAVYGFAGGGGGSSAGPNGDGNNGVDEHGAPAVTGGGAGADGGYNSGIPWRQGRDATTLGGGGGGGGSYSYGGSGGNGKVVVTYTTTGSLSNYTSEQTYAPTASFTPDTDHSHLNAIAGQITSKTFSIDAVASLIVQTVNALTSAPVGDVAYRITGTKKIGTDVNAQPVYVLDANDTTDSGGSHEYQSMVWDTYAIAIDGNATGYDIEDTSLPLPLVINPGAEETLTIKLAQHTPLSLHITVLSSAREPIENASVHVTKSGYDETKQTTVNGQAFFSDMPDSSDYAVTVDASGYQQFMQQATVDGTVHTQVTLVPL